MRRQSAKQRAAPRATTPDRADSEPGNSRRPQLTKDQPVANFAVRVRRSLDELTAWRLAELRRQGIRASKVELTEMLLWELADVELDQLAARLAAFREAVPR